MRRILAACLLTCTAVAASAQTVPAYIDASGNAQRVTANTPQPTTTGPVVVTPLLASNSTIAPTSATTPVSIMPHATYIIDVQFTGVSVQVQSLGADGVTWRNVGSPLTQSGSIQVLLGYGSLVRLYNPNATPDTGVYATLS